MSHVYVVLEYNSKKSGPKVHAVFANKEIARDKADKLVKRHKRPGYVAVLRKRILGL